MNEQCLKLRRIQGELPNVWTSIEQVLFDLSRETNAVQVR